MWNIDNQVQCIKSLPVVSLYVLFWGRRGETFVVRVVKTRWPSFFWSYLWSLASHFGTGESREGENREYRGRTGTKSTVMKNVLGKNRFPFSTLSYPRVILWVLHSAIHLPLRHNGILLSCSPHYKKLMTPFPTVWEKVCPVVWLSESISQLFLSFGYTFSVSFLLYLCCSLVFSFQLTFNMSDHLEL